MQESAQIAPSAVRSHARSSASIPESLGGAACSTSTCPPVPSRRTVLRLASSATALASLLTRRPVRHTVGMTGELTLQGRVAGSADSLKVLAAHAAGLTDVVLPERNLADIDDAGARARGDDVPSGHVPGRGARPRWSPSRPPPCRGAGPASRARGAFGPRGEPLEGRWTVSILTASYEGASRFNEFRQAVGTIPPEDSRPALARPRAGRRAGAGRRRRATASRRVPPDRDGPPAARGRRRAWSTGLARGP